MYGIDQTLEQTADAYRGNPQMLQQKYAQNQNLIDLLALQKLKSEKESAQREMQLKMGGKPPTIADQREQQVMDMTKQEVVQEQAGVMENKMRQQQEAQKRLMQAAGAPSQGIAGVAAPNISPQMMAGGGIVAFRNGGSPEDRIKERMTLAELQEYNRTKRIPARLQIMADPSVSGRMVDPIFDTETPTFSGMLGAERFDTPLTGANFTESVIAQAQRGEGPNVSRPAAPADVAVVPPGGPVIPRPTAIAESAPARSVVKKPESEKKPSSIFDEATNAANKLKAYKTQFGLTDTDPDAALRTKLLELQKGSKDERREAAYMAMIMAGLGIAGGTSPYFAVNLKEAIPALKEFGVAKRDIKKAEMEYTKMEADLNRAADARKRGDMELALGLERQTDQVYRHLYHQVGLLLHRHPHQYQPDQRRSLLQFLFQVQVPVLTHVFQHGIAQQP